MQKDCRDGVGHCQQGFCFTQRLCQSSFPLGRTELFTMSSDLSACVQLFDA
jgi:hypothetical protein